MSKYYFRPDFSYFKIIKINSDKNVEYFNYISSKWCTHPKPLSSVNTWTMFEIPEHLALLWITFD